MARILQTATLLTRPDRLARKILLLAFGSCAMFLIVAQVLEYWRSSQIRANVGLIEGNALESIRLIGVMGIATERERNLVSRHILEQAPGERLEIEDEIERSEQAFSQAASAYSPLATLSGESDAWRRLTEDIRRTRRPIARALELSRADRGPEAALVLKAVLPTYEAVSHDVDELLAIKRGAATRAKVDTAHLQSVDAVSRLGVATVLLCVMFVVGAWTTRVIVRLHRQLIQQQQELEERNRELDAFAGRVAHDLRGPLNTLSLSASMLAEQTPSDGSTVTIMRKGISQMSSLIDDLLALSRAGVVPGGNARVDVIAESIRQDLTPIAQQAEGVLRLNFEPANVACSEGMLRQVLWNLCENAIKYRRPMVDMAIDIVGRSHDGHYEIRISDNGIGLTHDEAMRVFDPFYRSERTKRVPGTGLGLAIVRRVVEAVGGFITVDSTLDQGTTFMVTLPLASRSGLSPRLA